MPAAGASAGCSIHFQKVRSLVQVASCETTQRFALARYLPWRALRSEPQAQTGGAFVDGAGSSSLLPAPSGL